jgi:hypothetical protein
LGARLERPRRRGGAALDEYLRFRIKASGHTRQLRRDLYLIDFMVLAIWLGCGSGSGLEVDDSEGFISSRISGLEMKTAGLGPATGGFCLSF